MRDAILTQTNKSINNISLENELKQQLKRVAIEAKNLGLKGGFKILKNVTLFALLNFALIIITFIIIINSANPLAKLLYLILIFMIGLGTCVFAGFKSYREVAMECINALHFKLAPVFKTFTSIFVQKAETVFQGQTSVNQNDLNKLIDTTDYINHKIEHMPRMLKIGMRLALIQVPFANILLDYKSEILSGNKDLAANLINNKIDDYVSSNVKAKAKNNWRLWLFISNIIIIGLIICFLIY